MFAGSPPAAMLGEAGKGTRNAGCHLPLATSPPGGAGQREQAVVAGRRGSRHSATSLHRDGAQRSPLYTSTKPQRGSFASPPITPRHPPRSYLMQPERKVSWLSKTSGPGGGRERLL